MSTPGDSGAVRWMDVTLKAVPDVTDWVLPFAHSLPKRLRQTGMEPDKNKDLRILIMGSHVSDRDPSSCAITCCLPEYKWTWRWNWKWNQKSSAGVSRSVLVPVWTNRSGVLCLSTNLASFYLHTSIIRTNALPLLCALVCFLRFVVFFSFPSDMFRFCWLEITFYFSFYLCFLKHWKPVFFSHQCQEK